MSTQVFRWLAAGAPGSHPEAHHLLFAHQSELYGEDLSSEALGGIVHKCDRSIRIAANNTVKRASDQCNALRTIPLLLNSNGTVLRIAEELDPMFGPEEICFAIISSPRSLHRGRPSSTTGDNGWRFRRAFTVGKREHFCVPEFVGPAKVEHKVWFAASSPFIQSDETAFSG
jgi:hypothetical protein